MRAVPPQPEGRMGVGGDLFVARDSGMARIDLTLASRPRPQDPSANAKMFVFLVLEASTQKKRMSLESGSTPKHGELLTGSPREKGCVPFSGPFDSEFKT